MANDGIDLEQAVEAIERLLLQLNPELVGRNVEVRTRKRQRIRGVLHEFDLWVSIDHVGVFLVECKNWAKPVGKNEIIVFAEKLRATEARGGYVVAPAFTADAVAQAKLSTNLLLRLATTEVQQMQPLPDYHGVFTTIISEESSVSITTVRASWEAFTTCIWRGSRYSADDFAKALLQAVLDERMSTEPTGQRADGTYRIICESRRKFSLGELMIGLNIGRYADVHLVSDVEVERPSLIWRFGVQDRGVAARYRHTRPEGTLDATFVLTPNVSSLWQT